MKTKKKQESGPTLDMFFDTALDADRIAKGLTERSQAIVDSSLHLPSDLIADTVHRLINDHHVGPDEIAIVVSSQSYRSEILDYRIDGVEAHDFNSFLRKVSGLAKCEIVPHWFGPFIAMADLPVIDTMAKIVLAHSFSETLEFLLGQGINPKQRILAKNELRKIIREKLGDNGAYLFGSRYQKRLSAEDVDSLIGAFQKFVDNYYNMKQLFGYVDVLDIALSAQKESVFRGKKYVIIANASDLTPTEQLLIRKQVDAGQVKSLCLFATQNSIYGFRGADPALTVFRGKGSTLDYYLNFEEIKALHRDMSSSKQRYEVKVPTSKLSSTAVHFATKPEAVLQGNVKNVAIVTETNYYLDEIRRILRSQGIPYKASIRVKANEDVLSIAAKKFSDGFSKPDDAMGLFASLKAMFYPALDASETIAKAEKRVYELLELSKSKEFQHMLSSLKLDLKQALINAILLTDFSKRFDENAYSARNIFVSTVYNFDWDADFDAVVYVSSRRGGSQSLNATSLLSEAIYSYYRIKKEEPVNPLVFLEKRFNIIKVDTPGRGTSEGYKLVSPPAVADSASLMREVATDWKDRVYNYFLDFKAGKHISYSLLSLLEKPANFVLEKIYGIRTYSEPSELGTSMHDIFKLSNENLITNEIREKLKKSGDLIFLENKEKIDAELIKNGYSLKSAEERIEADLNKVAQKLGADQSALQLLASGVLDAVFEKREGDSLSYLIIDYKTGAGKEYESNYIAQLLFYKLLFSSARNVPPERIETAIAYVGVRGPLGEKSTARHELRIITADEEDRAGKPYLRDRINELLRYISKPEEFIRRVEASNDRSIELISCRR